MGEPSLRSRISIILIAEPLYGKVAKWLKRQPAKLRIVSSTLTLASINCFKVLKRQNGNLIFLKNYYIIYM